MEALVHYVHGLEIRNPTRLLVEIEVIAAA
jgi:hypothetical protein